MAKTWAVVGVAAALLGLGLVWAARPTGKPNSDGSTSPVATVPTLPPDPPTGTSAPAPGLEAAVDRFLAGQPVPFSVVTRRLPAGPEVARLADRKVLSASLYKLFVARELLRRIHLGTLERSAPAAAAADGAGRNP